MGNPDKRMMPEILAAAEKRLNVEIIHLENNYDGTLARKWRLESAKRELEEIRKAIKKLGAGNGQA